MIRYDGRVLKQTIYIYIYIYIFIYIHQKKLEQRLHVEKRTHIEK